MPLKGLSSLVKCLKIRLELPSEAPFGCSPLGKGPGLNHKHYLSLIRLSRDKHSSLLRTFANYGRKKFYQRRPKDVYVPHYTTTPKPDDAPRSYFPSPNIAGDVLSPIYTSDNNSPIFNTIKRFQLPISAARWQHGSPDIFCNFHLAKLLKTQRPLKLEKKSQIWNP